MAETGSPHTVALLFKCPAELMASPMSCPEGRPEVSFFQKADDVFCGVGARHVVFVPRRVGLRGINDQLGAQWLASHLIVFSGQTQLDPAADQLHSPVSLLTR